MLSTLLLDYGTIKWGWDQFWINWINNIVLASISGLSVGIIYELFLRKNMRDEILSLVNIKRNIDNSGIQDYFLEFKNYINEIKNYLQKSKTIDIYLSYGSTIFNILSADLSDAFKRKNTTINIFVLDKNNPFVDSLGNLWGKIDKTYDKEGIKNKIDSTLALLIRLADTAYEAEDHAVVNIFTLKYHPINYSFYKFDEIILFCPSKVHEEKEFRAISLICKNHNKNDLFNWVNDELEYIKVHKDTTLNMIFPHN